jgi:hypothetical protein
MASLRSIKAIPCDPVSEINTEMSLDVLSNDILGGSDGVWEELGKSIWENLVTGVMVELLYKRNQYWGFDLRFRSYDWLASGSNGEYVSFEEVTKGEKNAKKVRKKKDYQ